MSTFKTNLPDNPPDGALELVLTWLNSEHAGPGSDEARALESWLQSGPDETALELCLSSSLLNALKCLAELRHWTAQDDLREGCHRLLQAWNIAASRLIDQISAGCTDWSHALGKACQMRDRMLIAILGGALEQVCEEFPLPAVPRMVAVRACSDARKWCERLPVPPAPNRSLVPGDYLYCGRHEALYTTLESLAISLADSDEQMLFQLICKRGPERNSGTVDEDDFVMTLEALSSALTVMLDGWPVEFVRLDEPLRLLRGYFATAEATAPVTDLIRLVRLAFSELDAYVTVSGRPLITDSSTEGESANDASGSAGLLKELIHWLSKQNSPLMSRYHNILCDVTLAAEQSEREVSTRLLDMLIGLNSELCVPSQGHEDLRSLRDRIHKILITLNFVILDDVLIGKPLSAVRHQVNVFRAYPSSFLPSDHVINVRQPGYLLTSASGDLCLVRPAEVNISR